MTIRRSKLDVRRWMCCGYSDERFRHGNFVRTIFSKRHADGVANSIRQQ